MALVADDAPDGVAGVEAGVLRAFDSLVALAMGVRVGGENAASIALVFKGSNRADARALAVGSEVADESPATSRDHVAVSKTGRHGDLEEEHGELHIVERGW